jgi:YidC/Oxa1 family membrane protein insertase
MGMQAAQLELDEINKKYKDNAEERARQTLALYKEKNIRPFAGILALFVQLPIFIALYFALFREGLPHIAKELLYPFVAAPATVNTSFLGFLDILQVHTIPLAVLVGVLQYIVAHISLSRTKAGISSLPKEKQTALRMQQNMMLYMFPALMAFIAFTLPAAVGIYFAASNLISVGQELLIKHQLRKKGQG